MLHVVMQKLTVVKIKMKWTIFLNDYLRPHSLMSFHVALGHC